MIGIGGLLPKDRCKGIGSSLLDTLLDMMRDEGFQKAIVDSGMTQTDAIKLYERFGFSFVRKQLTWIKML